MTGPLWRVGDGPATVWLYGEVAGVRDRSWCTPGVLAALPAAGSVWRETPDAEVVSASPAMASWGLAAVPLSQVLPPDLHARLVATCARLGGDATGLEGVRPWLAGQFVEAMHAQHLGLDPGHGAGRVLADLARERGLREEFELPGDTVLQLFGGLAPDVEVAYLTWMLDRAEDDAAAVARRVTLALAGDLSAAEADAAALRALDARLHDVVLTRRNERWADLLAALAAGSDDALAVVGLAHLRGPDGILAALTRRGIPVTGP